MARKGFARTSSTGGGFHRGPGGARRTQITGFVKGVTTVPSRGIRFGSKDDYWNRSAFYKARTFWRGSSYSTRAGFGDFESKHPRGYGGKFRRK